ncbi:NHL repeat protein, partial [Ostertagia ostertagi]
GIRVSLTGSPSKNCDGKRLNRPLGVTFDEALEQWLVADTGNDRVVLAPSGIVLTSSRMLAPCAVAVLEPGFSFAVLTKYDIRIMYHNKKESDVVITHSGSARGLALTPRKNFLILEKIKGFWNICIYEGKPRATLVNSAPYPNIENGLPSFLDVHRDLLIITDLGAQSLVRFSIDVKTEKLKFEESVFLGAGPKNRGHIEIKYISGVFIDNDENVLVADAKGHSLQVFTSRGIFLHAIKVVSGGLPYISGIWVNRNGFIGACARAETNGGLYVYRIVVPPPTDYKLPSLRS